MAIKSRSHGVGQNAHHLVWKPKYGYDILKYKSTNKVCEGAIRLVAMQYKIKIYELQVLVDHIHLFIELPSMISVGKALQLFKGISSRILKRNFKFLRKRPAVWSKGKFNRSVGDVGFETIQKYIEESQGGWKFCS